MMTTTLPTGPYHATLDDDAGVWKDGSGAPQERAFIRGPGLDGTILGTSAHAEACARAQQLNTAFAHGVEHGKRQAIAELAADTLKKGTPKKRRKR